MREIIGYCEKSFDLYFKSLDVGGEKIIGREGMEVGGYVEY